MLPASFTNEFLRQLELLRLQGRRAFLGTRQGGHLSIKRGHGIEFSDYRNYELGDHPRYIDWGVYARSERLYVKRFQEEQDLPVMILLDTSSSMNTPVEEGKWRRAKEIALALAYIALMQQDSVQVEALGSMHSPVFYGARAFHEISKILYSVKTESNGNFVKQMQRSAARIKFPGVAILISDFLMPIEEIEQGVRALRSRNLDITAIQLLGRSDIAPIPGEEFAQALDSETGVELSLVLSPEQREEYGTLLIQHNERVKTILAEGKVSYFLTTADEELSDTITRGVTEVGLLI